MAAICDIISRTGQLVTLPDVYLRVRAVLENEMASIADLVAALNQDPALCARLLRLANSVWFGYRGRVDSVGRAVVLVGTHQVHDLVLATAVAEAFEGVTIQGVDMEAYRRQSVYSGVTVRSLAGRCNVLDLERCFVEGLLSDVGHLVMYTVEPEKALQAQQEAKEFGETLLSAERRLLGCDYIQVGAALLDSWQVPESLQNAIRFQRTPDQAKDAKLGASLLNIAGVLNDALMAKPPQDPALNLIADTAWKVTRLTSEDVLEVGREALLETHEIFSLLFDESIAA